MDNGLQEEELLDLSSTYAFLTADRILDIFGLSLTNEKLTIALKNPRSVYYQLLLVPFKNIINGIIYRQAYDYQIYAQKLLVDYLVSGSGNDNPDEPGDNIRQDLDENRIKLIDLSEQFSKDEIAHKTLIHESQGKLVEIVKKQMPIDDNEQDADEISKSMSHFMEQATEISVALRNYRIEFKTIIVDTRRLIQLLPNYRENDTQNTENLQLLDFDDQFPC